MADESSTHRRLADPRMRRRSEKKDSDLVELSLTTHLRRLGNKDLKVEGEPHPTRRPSSLEEPQISSEVSKTEPVMPVSSPSTKMEELDDLVHGGGTRGSARSLNIALTAHRASAAPLGFADVVREVSQMRDKLRQGFLLDPNQKFMRQWDVVTMVALLFTATVTPYEVALLETELDALFFVNRLVDLVFVSDMVMNFFLMYRENAELGGGMVRDKKRIRRHYLRGWFALDFISILPFDIVAFALRSSSLGKMKALRIIRLLRLLKLVRILRASRIFKRWESSIAVSYTYLALAKFLSMVWRL